MEAEIRDWKKFVEVLKFAEETNSLKSLLTKLESFKRWEDAHIIFFFIHPMQIEFNLTNKGNDMHGGIVYHRHSSEWSINT